jgi:hyaluronate lyase
MALALVWVLLPAVAPRAHADQFDTLRSYWLNQLVGTNNSVSTLTGRASSASNYWNTLNGSISRTNLWSDLPFGSVSANITSTFSRLKTMALAWASPGCSLYGDTNLAAVVTNSLDWMAANIYSTSAAEYNNWWDWEIGSPQAFNDTTVLMYPALAGTQITNYNNAVDHFSPPTTTWMTGANLTDKCKVVLIRGILGKNSSKMTYGQTNMSPVFPYVTSSDGFYVDGSFVQHTKFAYTGTYGNVLLGDVAQLVNLLNGTSWQITDPNLTNVFNWVTDSYQPLIYRGAMMDMVRGRAISRYSEQEQGDGSSAVNNIKQIGQFAPPATGAAFTNWANSPALPPGQYSFAAMDRAVAWRSNFCFGLSMSSTRIANYESINGENLHGWFTGDGMTYLYLGNPDAQFTGDFWPTVDPYHLPGTTVEQTNRADSANQGTLSSQNWVGGAQVADSYGVAGMSLAAVASTLTAKKSWFMLDNEIVCLGAGVTAGGTNEIDTTVEDWRLGASPTNHFNLNGADIPPTLGWSSNLTSAAWFSLAGVGGYYFPGGATNMQAMLEQRIHSWSEINNGTYVGTTTALNTNSYLKLWFNHGAKPTNATYAYVILPNFSTTAVSNYAAAPDIVVLSNTPLVQAVSKPALGVVAANFWTNGNYSADLIAANKKSSVITLEKLTGISVGVADPTQTNTGAITVTLNRTAAATVSADPGITVVQLSPQIILSVNVSGSLGKTYQASFLYPPPTLTWDANTGTPGAQDGGGSWESPNWWTGSADMLWDDSTAYIAAFGAGGPAGTVALSNPHNAFSLVFNSVGSGAYTLAGPGALTVSNGITANATATITAPLNLPANQTWTVATNRILNVNGTLSAPSPMTLSLAGPGTLNLGGNNQISTNISTVNFTDTLNKFTLGITANTQTVAALDINDGVTAAVAGTGTLQVNGAAGFTVGGSTTGAAQTLDFSGLKKFIFNEPANVFSVGGQVSGVSSSGTVYLAATNIVTASTFSVQNITGSTSAQSSGNLYLGQNTTVNATTINVGLTRDNGFLRFIAGTTNPVLVLRASDGSGRANVTIGTRGSSYSSTATALVDLATNVVGACTLDAQLGTLLIANEAYCLTSSDVLNGIFVMSGGVLDATAITIGSKSSVASQSTGVVNGTFTQSNGVVKVSTLTLGDKITGNTGTLNANYNLSGGTLAAQNIVPGANSATRNLNWTGGAISNYDAATDLTIAAGVNLILSGTETFAIGNGRTATVNSVISGSGALVQSGGTLVLAATNTYSGPTTVSGGGLLVNGVSGTNTLTVSAGATLGGTGIVSGVTTIQSGGAIQNATGNLNLNSLNLGNAGNATSYSQFTIAAGGKILVTNLAVLGTNLVNILDASLAAGTNTLFNFAGAITGGGSFKLGLLPANVSARLQTNGTAIQLVTTPLVPPAFAGPPAFSAGKFIFNFSGTNGQSYRILGSTNLLLPLANWPALASGTFGAGWVSYTDNVMTNIQRFYRIASP